MRPFATRFFGLFLPLLMPPLLSASQAPPLREECTSAIIPAIHAKGGSPLIWKNRDTDYLSNRLLFVPAQPYAYIGLSNRDNPSGDSVYGGLNSEGFGIINTVGVNLPEAGPGEMKDLEGFMMADALRTCRTIEDFEAWLVARLGPELGSQANFAVLDASGKALLFEIHNHGYRVIDPAVEPQAVLVNTNFSRSGAEGKGAGYLRYERARQLFDALPPHEPVDPFTILGRFTRDTGHVLVAQPSPFEYLERTETSPAPFWVNTRDCIDKFDTSAALLLMGRNPRDEASVATLWVIPGEPLCAPALPFWVESGALPEALWKGKEARLWELSLKLKKRFRPRSEGNTGHYLDLGTVAGGGAQSPLGRLLSVEREIFAETQTFLTQKKQNYRAFQEAMVQKALAFLEEELAR